MLEQAKQSSCYFCKKQIPCDLLSYKYIVEINDERYICKTCVRKYTYDYPSNFTFYHKNEPEPRLYYGIELETAFTHKTKWRLSDFLAELPEQLFCIDDGSIYDGRNVRLAMEIVSHPMTLQYMQEHKDIWQYVLNWWRKGLNSYKTNSCGMHIHISKNYFSNNNLLSFVKLILAIQDLAIKISQRKKGELNRWASFDDLAFYHFELADLQYNKYRAINLTHTDTIETRIFRGTLHESSFWKNIEFIQACIECSKDITTTDKQLYKDIFMGYIKHNHNKFPNLYAFMSKRDLIG